MKGGLNKDQWLEDAEVLEGNSNRDNARLIFYMQFRIQYKYNGYGSKGSLEKLCGIDSDQT